MNCTSKLSDEANFRCIGCVQKTDSFLAEKKVQRRASAGVVSNSVPLMTRRPKLVRGLYLGKEPLEYQKPSTPFKFFQLKSNKCPEEDEATIKPVKRDVLYPGSLAVQTCSLQTRPVIKHREMERHIASARPRVASRVSSNHSGELKKKYTDKLLSSESISSFVTSKEDVFLVGNKPERAKSDQQTNVKLTRRSRSGKMENTRYRKDNKMQAETDLVRSRSMYEEKAQFSCVEARGKELLEHTGNVPEFRVEYLTFKISDYNIWSRTREG